VLVLGLGFGGAILQVPWRRLRVWVCKVCGRGARGCHLQGAGHAEGGGVSVAERAGGDRGRDRLEPCAGGLAGHGAHADQIQAAVAHEHHHLGAAVRTAQEGAAQGVRGRGGGAAV
jgi:hypothetical protein